MKKRMFLLLICIVFLICTLTGRLFWIQVVDSHGFSSRNIDLVQHSVMQRAKGIILDDGRADFYDRHLEPLTGTIIQTLVVFPIKQPLRADDQQTKALADILQISLEGWDHYLDHLKEPQLWRGISNLSKLKQSIPVQLTPQQAEAITALNIPEVQVVPYKLRYYEPFLASHIIGFVGQNPRRIQERYREKLDKGHLAINSTIGAAGLENSLDTLLHGVEKTSISLFTDGKNRPLEGLKARVKFPTNSFYPLKAVTTLDKTIQARIEMILDKMNIKHGAVVVLDAGNADIVSMVSRPNFDPNAINLSLGDWGNKALKAAIPGSVFKTVVAAAALEGGWVSPHEVFQCNGSLGKYNLSCWKEVGHGRPTFEQAFAQSCNVTFAQVMERIPSLELVQAAKKLGLIQQVGWSSSKMEVPFVQLDSEEVGKIFDNETPMNDGGVKAQTSIGQRDVMITPLQAANLIVTLLHDGEVKSPRVIKELLYHNNRLSMSFQEKVIIPKQKGISTMTSRTLLHWMGNVVTEGTGQPLKQSDWKLAGKSGTAQVQSAGIQAENHWFIGYGPVEKPKYAAAVLVQTQDKEGTHQAIKIFKEVMNLLSVS